MPSSSPSAALSPGNPPPVIALRPSLAAGASSSFRLSSPSLNSVRLRRVFDIFDRDDDGEISLAELTTALSVLGLSGDAAAGDPGIADAVAAFVPPGHTGLDFPAFLALHRALGDALEEASSSAGGSPAADGGNEEADMREAFKVFDVDGDGYISAHELQVVLQKLGLPEGRCLDRVQEMIHSVDRDQDGRVDFDEFRSMMKSIEAKTSSS